MSLKIISFGSSSLFCLKIIIFLKVFLLLLEIWLYMCVQKLLYVCVVILILSRICHGITTSSPKIPAQFFTPTLSLWHWFFASSYQILLHQVHWVQHRIYQWKEWLKQIFIISILIWDRDWYDKSSTCLTTDLTSFC